MSLVLLATSRFIPESIVTGRSVFGPQREAWNAEVRRLLLHASGIGHHDRRDALECEEVEIARGLDELHVAAERGEPQVVDARARARVHRKHDRASCFATCAIAFMISVSVAGIVHVRRTMQRRQREVPGPHANGARRRARDSFSAAGE